MEADIPCPVCGEQVGMLWFNETYGTHYVFHVDDDDFGNLCEVDKTDVRNIAWMFTLDVWEDEGGSYE